MLTRLVKYVELHHTAIGSGFLALSLIGNLSIRSFHSPLLLLTWTALVIGVLLTGVSIGNRRVFYSLVLLLIFHALAIPSSLIWGDDNWELTAGVVLWMAPALLLYLANDPQQVFRWLVPAWLAHAGIIIWAGLSQWEMVGVHLVRDAAPSGLANNSNLAAGFLALGAVYLLTTPLKWLSVPLLIALLFTGSRWGVAVVLAVSMAMVITRTISWRPLLAAAIAMAGSVAFLGLFTPLGYAVAGIDSFAGIAHAVTADVGTRLAIPHLPTFLPSGVAEHPGLHNVPLRIAVENGLIAAGIWVLITGWALLPVRSMFIKYQNRTYTDTQPYKDNQETPRRPFLAQYEHRNSTQHGNDPPNDGPRERSTPSHIHRWLLFPFRWLVAPTIVTARPIAKEPNHQPSTIHANPSKVTDQKSNSNNPNNVHRWLLLTLVLLSMLDYYSWMGHLGGFWWLLIGLLLKDPARRPAASPEPNPANIDSEQSPAIVQDSLSQRTTP